MTHNIYEAAFTAPGAVLSAVLGAAALLLPVVMLAWGGARGFAADLSNHPSPFRARLLAAAKASLAIPAAVALGTLLLQGGWWSAASPLAELGPGAFVMGLTLWFALIAWARISEAARLAVGGARQSRADSHRFAHVFRALKVADPGRAEDEAAWALALRDDESAASERASEAGLRLLALVEDFERRIALLIRPLEWAQGLLEPRSAPPELMEILSDEACAEAARRLRPHGAETEPGAERDAARDATRGRLGSRASGLARRRSLRLALWHAVTVRQTILEDRSEAAADFVYALESRLRPDFPRGEFGSDASDHEPEGVLP